LDSLYVESKKRSMDWLLQAGNKGNRRGTLAERRIVRRRITLERDRKNEVTRRGGTVGFRNKETGFPTGNEGPGDPKAVPGRRGGEARIPVLQWKKRLKA